MRIDIMTLFPDTVNAVLHESIIGRAAKKGIIEINCVQIRDFTENKQCQVDDYPYGGGWGCVMMAQPLKSCLENIMSTSDGLRSRVIYMSPQGKPYTQETAKRLRNDYDHLVLVCGHYEGIDERFIEDCVDEEISLGDFVLTGGEIAAMAVADSVCRLVPGVLADEQCYTGESHWDGLLEYPQYTRPEVWEGRAVPEVLNFSENCIKSETMLAYLAEQQIYVSSASACGRGQPSHTLAAMGRDPLAIDTAIRVSFCADNTPEDVDAFLNRFEDGMRHLHKIKR